MNNETDKEKTESENAPRRLKNQVGTLEVSLVKVWIFFHLLIFIIY